MSDHETLYETILDKYGFFVLICVRNIMSDNRLQEECTLINDILIRNRLPTSMTLEQYSKKFGSNMAERAQMHIDTAIQMCIEHRIITKHKT